jgi:large subunit ribosomal protein L23|tara:strand:+ start:206 stop:562 length:357 start_codon:yes stop_codon:yes gene_type:complete
MALFGKKKETTDKKVNDAPKALATDHNLDGVLLNPRLTEKSVMMGDKNVYTFEIHKDATKYQVRDAVKAFYNVTPVKVNIVNKKPAKRLQGSRGKMVHAKGMKKAYVYLKKGDSINLV